MVISQTAASEKSLSRWDVSGGDISEDHFSGDVAMKSGSGLRLCSQHKESCIKNNIVVECVN